MNPWGLTKREVDALDAMLATGTRKAAADRLNVSIDTLWTHIQSAKRKMSPEHRLAHYLMWHQWRRESQWIETLNAATTEA